MRFGSLISTMQTTRFLLTVPLPVLSSTPALEPVDPTVPARTTLLLIPKNVALFFCQSSTDDDVQSMVDDIQVGRKYEFMMGRSQVGVKSGARDVFSFSGPVD